jgi:hypothetical protein
MGNWNCIVSIGQETFRDEPLGDVVVGGRFIEFSVGF